MRKQQPRNKKILQSGLSPVPIQDVQDTSLAGMGMRLLLSPQEAADALGINRSTLYELIMRDEIPSLKIGRARRIPLKALNEWITNQTAA